MNGEVTIFIAGLVGGIGIGLVIGALAVLATKNMKKEEKK